MSDETAAKPISAETLTPMGRALLEASLGNVERAAHDVPAEMAAAIRHALATIDSQASALAEAKVEIARLQQESDDVADVAAGGLRNQAVQAERIVKLEAATAKVPHIFKALDGRWALEYGYVTSDLHEQQRCAELGGQCLFVALASPSEPAGAKREGE